ncbi:hypothetical protein MLD38_012469 [Melastoma candidum]|uniref:Uncharacterized protein n=1 Tax=Melastoma candidum TaxID=119954 RepID=A0ACB9R9J5_9MYRT|nr:hypothetical protein MLD38_012469 [Melastoma candidum]
MAAFLGHPPPFLSHPVLPPRTLNFSSSTPPPQPPPQQPNQPQPLGASSSPVQQEPVSLPQKKPAAKTSVDSTDWIATSLTRRFGLGAGLAWAGFLAVGVLSEQIKTRLEVSQQEANTRCYDSIPLLRCLLYKL